MDIFSLQLKSYEDDFRHESEEKKAFKKKLDLKEQEIQTYMQSHLTTMRVLKNEVRGSLHESGLSLNPKRHLKFNLCLHGRLS